VSGIKALTYQLTQHAADVVSRRGIQADWIARTLDAPDKIESDQRDPSLVHHVRKIEEFGGRALRVVFDPKPLPPRVVTVYFDRSVEEPA
jgi:hypothetical protein